MGKVSAMGQPTKPTQPSIPTGITGVETIKRQTRAAYGWLVVGQSVGAGLAYGLWAVRPLCLWHKSAAAAAVCGLWRYTSVRWPLPLSHCRSSLVGLWTTLFTVYTVASTHWKRKTNNIKRLIQNTNKLGPMWTHWVLSSLVSYKATETNSWQMLLGEDANLNTNDNLRFFMRSAIDCRPK